MTHALLITKDSGAQLDGFRSYLGDGWRKHMVASLFSGTVLLYIYALVSWCASGVNASTQSSILLPRVQCL